MPDQEWRSELKVVQKSIYVLRTPDNGPVNVAGFGSREAAKAARDRLAAKGIVTVVSRGPDHPQGPSFPTESASLRPARLAQPEPKQEPSPRPTSSNDPIQSTQQRLTSGETLSPRPQPSSNHPRPTLKERLKKHPVAAAIVSFFILNILIGVLIGEILGPVKCRDGWNSPSIGQRGACSWHGGVDRSRGGWVTLLSLIGAVGVGVWLGSSDRPR